MADKNKGWIRLDRSIIDHWLWNDKPFDKARAWIDLLLLANHEDTKTIYRGELIVCKRGDVCRSVSWLADRWGWTRKTARGFLSALESDGMVSVKCTTNRTTVTIENYGKYQGVGTTKYPTKVQRGTQRGDSEVPTYNNVNNVNNDKQIKTSPKYEFYIDENTGERKCRIKHDG